MEADETAHFHQREQPSRGNYTQGVSTTGRARVTILWAILMVWFGLTWIAVNYWL